MTETNATETDGLTNKIPTECPNCGTATDSTMLRLGEDRLVYCGECDTELAHGEAPIDFPTSGVHLSGSPENHTLESDDLAVDISAEEIVEELENDH